MMRKAVLFILFSIVSFAQQVPQMMSHRGTAYNTSGVILTDADISLKIRIFNGGTTDYEEKHQGIHTNLNGQYNLNIGQGTLITGNFSNIDWSTGNKWLEIAIDPANGTSYTVVGASQLMSVPFALYANSTNQESSVKIVNKISDLRSLKGNEKDVVYVKYHTDAWDGGGGFFTLLHNDVVKDKDGIIKPDNDGTIIVNQNLTSYRWVRKTDKYIDVRFFGTYGNSHNDDGIKIQKAIDAAAQNVFASFSSKGTTVFIPAGNYKINNTLILKTGVSIEGENYTTTILTAGYNTLDGNMIEMDKGRIEGVNISNITFTGNSAPGDGKTKNCMYLKATFPSSGIQDGGIWGSTFKNIKINQFNGSGIILEGGGGANYAYNLPNQSLIFENIHIERQTDNSNCLLIQGQHGQLTFITCGFDGKIYGGDLSSSFNTSKYYNVVIENKAHVQSAAIMFLTCTFQYSEYGIYLKFAENVTFDNCWFEILDRSIGIKQSSNTNPLLSSASINVLNSRFANASGFGSYHDNVSNRSTIAGVGTGSCIYVEESNVNIFNNFVTVTDTFDINNRFIMNYSTKSLINSGNNSFQIPDLGFTYGLANGIINIVNNSISTFNNKFISVNPSVNIIKQINSNLEAGQSLTIRSEGTSIKFDNTKNIKLTKPSPITLNYDETATFIKVDSEYNNLGQNYKDYWMLVSITKVN